MPQTPTPAGRILTAARYRSVAEWTRTQCFDGWSWADKVMAVVAALIEDEHGIVHGDELARAVAEPATVDVALDLLGASGAACA